MAVRPEVQFCGPLIARVAGSNYAENMDVLLLRVWCLVWIKIYVTNRSLAQGSPTGRVYLIVRNLVTSKRSGLGPISDGELSKN